MVLHVVVFVHVPMCRCNEKPSQQLDIAFVLPFPLIVGLLLFIIAQKRS